MGIVNFYLCSMLYGIVLIMVALAMCLYYVLNNNTLLRLYHQQPFRIVDIE